MCEETYRALAAKGNTRWNSTLIWVCICVISNSGCYFIIVGLPSNSEDLLKPYFAHIDNPRADEVFYLFWCSFRIYYLMMSTINYWSSFVLYLRGTLSKCHVETWTATYVKLLGRVITLCAWPLKFILPAVWFLSETMFLLSLVIKDCAICCERLCDPSGYESSSTVSDAVKLVNCKHEFHKSCLLAMYRSGTKVYYNCLS